MPPGYFGRKMIFLGQKKEIRTLRCDDGNGKDNFSLISSIKGEIRHYFSHHNSAVTAKKCTKKCALSNFS